MTGPSDVRASQLIGVWRVVAINAVAADEGASKFEIDDVLDQLRLVSSCGATLSACAVGNANS